MLSVILVIRLAIHVYVINSNVIIHTWIVSFWHI
jgi:hypothetical protein